jgi:autotransporter-associated beta strand protein
MKHLHLAGLSAATIATSMSLSAQSVWNGATGNYTDPANWTPAGVPASGTAIEINAGTATNGGNLARAATSLVGGGNLVVNGRFLNASGGPAAFTVASGSLTQTGNYFIVGQNNAGTFTQTDGTVNVTVDRGFFISDGGGQTSSLTVSGGSFSVAHTGSYNTDLHNTWIGRNGPNDSILVNGGDFSVANTASPAAGSPGRRFNLTRNGRFQIDSGSATISGMEFIFVGNSLGAGTSRFLVNGGETEVSVSDSFTVGGGQNGLLSVTDGVMDILSLGSLGGNLRLDDSAGTRSNNVDQSGGTLTVDANVVINGNAQYFMRGGSLAAADITAGTGVNPKFFYQGGTVTLSGDQTGIVDEPFFFSYGDVSASYDGNTGTTTLSVTPADGFERSYQFYRFTATQLRSGLATGAVQVSELELLNGGLPVDLTGATATSPGGNSPINESPAQLIDGNIATKWLDFNNAPVVIDFGVATAVDGYRLTTGNDAPERDPVRWTIEGSADGVTWELIDRVIDTGIVPTGRSFKSIDIPLRENVATPVLAWSGNINGSWDTTTQNWDESGPRAWSNANPLLDAVFDVGATTTAITLAEPIRAGLLSFRATGYSIDGAFPLELSGLGQIEALEDATISSSISGNFGLSKLGGATLALGGINTFAGNTSVLNGSVQYTGSSASTGGGTLLMGAESNSRTALLVDTTGTLTYNGSPRIGIGENAAAVIRQTNGELVTGGPGIQYLELGGSDAATAGSYGAYLLEDGTYNSGGLGTESGVRVGREGQGVFHQTGGIATIARWFAIGAGSGSESEGLTNLLGGSMTINPGFRILLGDAVDSIATFNLGTQAGGTATLVTLNGSGLSVGQNTNASAVLNLNQGSLILGGPIFRNGSGATAVLNLDDASIIAGSDNIDLISSTLSSANLFNGGLTVDTAGNSARITATLANPAGSGVYPEGGALTVTDGGANYLAPPFVAVSTNGSGIGLTAIAEVVGGVITRVLITSPGSGYQAGDALTFTFLRGGPTAAAPDFIHTLTAADLEENHSGSLVKTGLGTLDIQGQLNHEGETIVEQGTLAINGFAGTTPISVEAAGTLTGGLNAAGPVTVAGTLAPGNGVGTAQSLGSLTMEAGSTLAIDLVDWDGAQGSGYDSMSFNGINIEATTLEKLTVRIDASGLSNFAEADKSLLLATGVSGLSADNWEIDVVSFPGTGGWELTAIGGELRLEYTAGTGTDYTLWLAGFPDINDPAAEADPDFDGIANVLEYVLGGDPTSGAAPSGMPTAQAQANGDLIFTFIRRAGSKDTTVQTFQYGSDLAGWTDVPIPAASQGNVAIAPDSPQPGNETITITVDAANAPSGRIFGRLKATALN